MEIRKIDNAVTVVENGTHEDPRQPQKRHQQRKKEKIPSGPVYKPNGKVEEEPPPNIDVLV